MKRKMLYIIFVFFLVFVVAGGTYSYLSTATTTNNNAINTTGDTFTVVYTKGEEITGPLELATDKSGGLSTSVTIGMAEGSTLTKGSIYLDIDNISNNMVTNPTNNQQTNWQNALKWEVYGYDEDGNQVFPQVGDKNSGTFLECTETRNELCVTGKRLYLIKDYQLTYENIRFDIYFWLNGHEVDNAVGGATFAGNINAKTENKTADLTTANN